MATTTKQFPSGDAIYVARYEEGLTWSEMRAHFAVSARSSRFLSECVAHVNATPELLERHPEMALIPVGGEKYEDVGREARDVIRAERSRGVGLAMLRERTGLTMAVLRKIVGEEVGTTSRVAWGARYAGKRTVTEDAPEGEATPESTPEADAPEATPEVVEETTPEPSAEKAAPRRRRRQKAAK
jgi:hypothetical protein